MNNKKGFTLVEVLLIILVLGLISITAVSSYLNAAKTFNFVGAYKQVTDSVRTARSYALTNRDSENVDHYGVEINQKEVISFADTGSVLHEHDNDDQKFETRSYKFVDTNYELQVTDFSLPLTLLYATGSGELFVYDDNGLIEKDLHSYVEIGFFDTEEDIDNYIVVFLLSGLIEEFKEALP